jgi:putative endonuclease
MFRLWIALRVPPQPVAFTHNMPHARQQLGDFGEQAAAAHLIRAGYQILARKWRCVAGEIDLIAHDNNEIVCIEVRTRRTNAAALESVGRAKQRRLAKLATLYLQSIRANDTQPWRIDVIAITIGRNGQITRLEHVKSAVEG